MRSFILLLSVFLSSCEPSIETIEKEVVVHDTVHVHVDSIQPKVIEPDGTQVLPNKDVVLQLSELGGFYLKDILVKPCEERGELNRNKDNNVIKHAGYTDSSYNIEVFVIERCGADFLCWATYVDKETIALDYVAYDSYASCYCGHVLTYVFSLNSDSLSSDNMNVKFVKVGGEGRVPV